MSDAALRDIGIPGRPRVCPTNRFVGKGLPLFQLCGPELNTHSLQTASFSHFPRSDLELENATGAPLQRSYSVLSGLCSPLSRPGSASKVLDQK